MARRFASIVIVALVLATVPPAAIASSVEVTDGTQDLFASITNQPGPNNAGAGGPVAQDFYADFIDITHAAVSLDSGTYAFQLTVLGQVLPAHPQFSGDPKTPITSLDYLWRIIDCSSGSCFRLGSIAVHWHSGVTTAALEVLVGGSCPGPEVGPECRYPEFATLPLNFDVDSTGHTLSVTVSKAALTAFVAQSPFGSHPTNWRAQTRAFINPPVPINSSASISVNDVAPNFGTPPALLP